MRIFKKKPLWLLLFVVGFGQLIGCAVPHAMVYVDNSACAKSLADGVIATISDDWDKETIDIAELIDLDKRLSMILYSKTLNKEFNHFSISSRGTDYSFLFQTNNDGCWLRLYKKEGANIYYTNTMTFIRSEKLEGCRCGNNDIEIQMGL